GGSRQPRRVAEPARSGARLAGFSPGGTRANLRVADRGETGQGGPAAARRPDGQLRVATRVRRHGRAGPRGGAGAHPRPGRLVTKILLASAPCTALFLAQRMACRSAIDILLRVIRRLL